MKPSGPGLCLQGIFKLQIVSLAVISLFKLSVSSWFGLGRLYVSGNSSISSVLSNLLAYNCSYYSLMILYLCDNCCYSSSFISYFIGVLFLGEPGLEVCWFCLSFQKTSSWLYWSFLLFFWSIYFLSDLYYFLPSADFVLFLTPLDGRLDWDFYFLRRVCIAVNSPLRTALWSRSEYGPIC